MQFQISRLNRFCIYRGLRGFLMAHTRCSGPSTQLDIEQILTEAQYRWLRTLEIREILRNYERFNITPEPPNMPPSGSLFLFDRKVLRYFRKDGHSWRKKKDGKTVNEAHEKLKVGSIDVLHCYYAHGEDNENFQRRSYWMLEEELSHIVLVHYREVKDYRTHFNRFKETGGAIVNALEIEQYACNSEGENSMNSSLQNNSFQMLSENTDSKSLNSAQASDHEDAESGSHQAEASTVPSLDIVDDRSSQKHYKEFDLWGWEDALQSRGSSVQFASVSIFNMELDSEGIIAKQGNEVVKNLLTDPSYKSQPLRNHVQGPEEWQPMHTMDHGLQMQVPHIVGKEYKSDSESNLTVGKRSSHFSDPESLLDRSFKEGLKKNDSFSRWMTKELGEMEPVVSSCSAAYWDVDDESDCPSLSPQAGLDAYTLGPSLSQEQFFRIIDFSPNWGYAGSETKVLIAGEFLKTQKVAGKCQWSCMFGEVEVPAEVIADGVLRCHAPLHGVATRVPFYVTCSNRLACSEVREFEYRDKSVRELDILGNRCEALQLRFGKLLSSGSSCRPHTVPCSSDNSSNLHHEITSLLKGNESEWFQILQLTSKDEISAGEVKERLTEKLLKEKFCEWLLRTEAEGGNGPRVLDEDGQGVLHFAAALGYDWAIFPTVASGLNVNFRDVRGWTALHWAASYGRERTVVYLISLGASAGALTDPTPTYPMGKTAADLASENGHKGIAGYLAESALSSHLECLTMKDKSKQGNSMEPSGMTPVLTASERMAIPISDGDDLDGLSLKDSLAAVRNAAQAAARIHELYRVHSFKRKQMRDFDDDKMDGSDEHTLSAITVKIHHQGQHDEPVHAAAIRIQNKFRSWKGRREFLTLKQQVVKIQAHVRGHQVRKHYKKFVWSVGIMEKVILRWRRKRSGLRGFKPESLTVEPCSEEISSKEDDYDFLKEGRKQAEERQKKALSRVNSMVRYPEARDQYRRLLTTVKEIKDMKDDCSGALDSTEVEASMGDDLVDVDILE